MDGWKHETIEGLRDDEKKAGGFVLAKYS